MSRIGKLPIALNDKVKVEVNERDLLISSGNSSHNYTLSYGVKAEIEDGNLKLIAKDNSVPKITMYVGMDRSNLNNIISGLVKPFKIDLEVNGVGYKFNINGQKIVLFLGYSHEIVYILPKEVTAVFEKPNILALTSTNKELLGKVSSEIISFRPVEPYKGKGIKIKGSYVRRKEGKKK